MPIALHRLPFTVKDTSQQKDHLGETNEKEKETTSKLGKVERITSKGIIPPVGVLKTPTGTKTTNYQ